MQSKRHASSWPLTLEALTLGELTALHTLHKSLVNVKRKEIDDGKDDGENDRDADAVDVDNNVENDVDDVYNDKDAETKKKRNRD